jgi:hypothetical protein
MKLFALHLMITFYRSNSGGWAKSPAQGQLHSIAFLKALLDLARDLVNAKKEVPPAEDEDCGKTALTELFQQSRNADTPIMLSGL